MTETLITAAIILGVVVSLFIWVTLLTKKRHNAKLAKQKIVLADIIWKNKLEVAETETINNHLLAIDRINFVLLYISFAESKEKIKLIDLWQIKTIKVHTEDDLVYEDRKGQSVLVDRHVGKLQLELTFADNQQLNLLLYHYNDGMQDFVHIKKRAEYWCQLIKISLQELPKGAGQKLKFINQSKEF